MTFPSGAYKGRDEDLYCRSCGRLADIEDGKLSCDNGCFSEEYRQEAED